MNTALYTETEQTLPVIGQVDVAVTGGGTAGVTAALAAARVGASVCVIEQQPALGGASLWAPVPSWENHYVDANGRPALGGLPVAILSELVTRKHTIYRTMDEALQDHPSIWVNTYGFSVMVTQMIRRAGVRIMLNTACSRPILNGNRVAGVVVENNEGRQAVKAACILDCTGNAAVAAGAGAPHTRVTRGSMGLMFSLANVDFKTLLDYWAAHPNVASPEWEAWVCRQAGLEPDTIEQTRWRSWLRDLLNGTRNWPSSFGPRNCRDEQFISVDEIRVIRHRFLSRQGMAPFIFPTPFIKECIRNACAAGDLTISRNVGPDACVMFDMGNNFVAQGDPRSGRLLLNMLRVVDIDTTDNAMVSLAECVAREYLLEIVGFFRDYVPGFENAALEEVFGKTRPRKERHILGVETFCPGHEKPEHDKRSIGLFASAAEGLLDTIPYGVLVPREVDGLLVAGLACSGGGKLRHVPNCLHLGEVAGTAAALSIRSGVVPRDLDVRWLQENLAAAGIPLWPRDG